MDDSTKINILIATQQPSIRNGLKFLLYDENDLYVVTEAHDSHELLKKTESTCPDIVLLDWELIDRSTPILVSTLNKMKQSLMIIVFSPEADLEEAALNAGAKAFVNIGNPPKELLTVISNVFNASRTKDNQTVIQNKEPGIRS